MAKIRIGFKTFGCKLNQYDTDFLKQAFQDAGYSVPNRGPYDLVVVNTCAVTARSAAKCRQAIRQAARSGAKVLVTGCYSQVAQAELKDLPGVVAVTGVLDRESLVEIARKALSTGETIVEVKPHRAGQPFQETPVREPSLTRAFLKIQEGCDDYCTYCIVPYARGPSRSRSVESILEEARSLVEKGYKEIVLTGTHIGLYGKDLEQGKAADRAGGRNWHKAQDKAGEYAHGEKIDLPLVVRKLTEIDGLVRLRISSLEPHDVTPELIHCLRFPQVCNHLHLPIQSGSDKVLKLMGRRYDVAGFLDIVNQVRKVVPDIGLSADVIVGFPGETEEDFESTLDVISRVKFSRLHVFKFSPRPGTPAYGFPGKVSGKEMERRSKAVIALGKELSLDFHRKLIGREVEVLVEDARARDGKLQGVTRNYVRTWFDGPDELKGRLIAVRAYEASSEGLLCQPVK
ncbi:MAG TPA: tRNA (N(6)-L-threonylcarbamoyladenosine(37)-C(2))-methylthiotransferase MtaB [Clostridiales bacterium UBA9857]|nr:MiaB/RimO family radical SAM methylthiotransferase [Candidatus Fermentithermobacillaceae bacterium]HAF66285.1 tRNA (N(6)-L-threonylcarbamoyladenosine(37)-C(2))-methylthiotransferase MtaB [Clostridiales bacterium UBA9857]